MTELRKIEIMNYYASTYCTSKELAEHFDIPRTTAADLISKAIDQIKWRRKMEIIIESGLDYNQEQEIRGIESEEI